jgi:DNA-binding transcriptional regulator YiaG
MGKIESTLRDEITRLASKELRVTVTPLVREVRGLRRTVNKLNKTVAVLEREAGKRKKAKQEENQALSVPDDEVKAARITPAWVQNLRMKLNLSQPELASLVGVSASAVRSWEYDKAKPSGERKAALVALKKLGRRDVYRMLEEMETAE